jgi:hypothetical protein
LPEDIKVSQIIKNNYRNKIIASTKAESLAKFIYSLRLIGDKEIKKHS